ncbi:hypothetical protein KJ632_01490, partial [Patescibacteria group bacterium]|nr:hypothetical protein [Patescibacteria group bacterium]
MPKKRASRRVIGRFFHRIWSDYVHAGKRLWKYFWKGCVDLKKRAGATSLVAAGISILMVMYILGMHETIRDGHRQNRIFTKQTQATMAAESFEQIALLMGKDGGPGYSMAMQVDTRNGCDFGTNSSFFDGCVEAYTSKSGVEDCLEDNSNCTAIGLSDDIVSALRIFVRDIVAQEGSGCDGPIPGECTSPPGGTSELVAKAVVEGKNAKGIAYGGWGADFKDSSGEVWYPIPGAGSGDAGGECDEAVYGTLERLAYKYVGRVDSEAYARMGDLFNYEPLNHPCHWGKLKFGDSFSSRVRVP